MNFTIRVVGFSKHEFRFKAVSRQERASNVVNFVVRALADEYDAVDPDDPDQTEAADIFWAKISERPYFISDDELVARDVDDSTVGVAFRELDTGVVAGEVGWIGFHEVWQSIRVDGDMKCRLRLRDAALLRLPELLGRLPPNVEGLWEKSTLLCHGITLKGSDQLFRYVDDSGVVNVHAKVDRGIDIVVHRIPATKIRSDPLDFWPTTRLSSLEGLMTLRRLQGIIEDSVSVKGIGFIDWDNLTDPSHVALLHPDTQLLDLTEDSMLLELWLVVPVSQTIGVDSPLRTRLPLARVSLPWKKMSIDVPLLRPPFAVHELLRVLESQGHLVDLPRTPHVLFGRERLELTADLWTLIPEGIAPLVLLTIEI